MAGRCSATLVEGQILPFCPRWILGGRCEPKERSGQSTVMGRPESPSGADIHAGNACELSLAEGADTQEVCRLHEKEHTLPRGLKVTGPNC